MIKETLEQVLEIQAKSAARMVKSGEEGIPAGVVMMHYEGLNPTSSSAQKPKKQKAAKKA